MSLVKKSVLNTFIAQPASVTHPKGSIFVHLINSFLYLIQPTRSNMFLQYIESYFLKSGHMSCYALIPQVKFV